MSRPITAHLRTFRPAEGIRAYYDGRIEGHRFADEPNWVDGGALSLGVCSYALVEGDEAIVYDTHVTVDHARAIRAALEAEGVRRFIVVLSHWHLDHIAGTEAFADCEIIANRRTMAHLTNHRAAIETGTKSGPPGISPLILPTRLFEGALTLRLGGSSVHLIELDIHSDDATVIWLPDRRILLAGDTLEDTVTYVDEPDGLDRHLADLEKLRALDPAHILPNHGDPEIIAGGGYGRTLIDATRDYITTLQRVHHDPALRALTLKDFAAPQIEAGWIRYFEPYEDVHRSNVEQVLATSGGS